MTTVTLGAAGVTATLSAGSTLNLAVTNGLVGLLAQTQDSGGTPQFAMLATGDVALNGLSGVTL